MRLCEGSPSSDEASIAFEALHGKRRASGMSKVSPSSGMDETFVATASGEKGPRDG